MYLSNITKFLAVVNIFMLRPSLKNQPVRKSPQGEPKNRTFLQPVRTSQKQSPPRGYGGLILCFFNMGWLTGLNPRRLEPQSRVLPLNYSHHLQQSFFTEQMVAGLRPGIPWAADQPLKKSYYIYPVGPVLRYAQDSAPSLQLGRSASHGPKGSTMNIKQNLFHYGFFSSPCFISSSPTALRSLTIWSEESPGDRSVATLPESATFPMSIRSICV
jgi:hypothetical protein